MTNRQKPLFVSSVRVPRSSYIPVALAGRYFQTPINRKEPTTLLCVCECEHVCVCVFESGGMRPQTQTVCVWDAALFYRSLFGLHRSLPYPVFFFTLFLFFIGVPHVQFWSCTRISSKLSILHDHAISITRFFIIQIFFFLFLFFFFYNFLGMLHL